MSAAIETVKTLHHGTQELRKTTKGAAYKTKVHTRMLHQAHQDLATLNADGLVSSLREMVELIGGNTVNTNGGKWIVDAMDRAMSRA